MILDEKDVPVYSLPKIFSSNVQTSFDWMNYRRWEVLELFKKTMYGEMLPRPDSISFEDISYRDDALNGKAIRKEVRVHLGMNNGRKHHFDLLIYLPKCNHKVPAFLGLNFKGNHATTLENDVRVTGQVYYDLKSIDSAGSRGVQAERWHFEQLIDQGYGAATVCYHDIFPDDPTAWNKSVYQLFGDFDLQVGTHHKYGAIGAWAWGLSRAMDYLESNSAIDSSKVIVHGHSRLGKTAIWSAANDPRFVMAISNDSGCCGAALSRRCFGETVAKITDTFPHWFIKELQSYNNNEVSLPLDQHMFLALIAPRVLAVGSASEDLWADPYGEFLSLKHAQEVYSLFGINNLEEKDFPEIDQFITGVLSYHCRAGVHDQKELDWIHYTKIANKFIKSK